LPRTPIYQHIERQLRAPRGTPLGPRPPRGSRAGIGGVTGAKRCWREPLVHGSKCRSDQKQRNKGGNGGGGGCSWTKAACDAPCEISWQRANGPYDKNVKYGLHLLFKQSGFSRSGALIEKHPNMETDRRTRPVATGPTPHRRSSRSAPPNPGGCGKSLAAHSVHQYIKGGVCCWQHPPSPPPAQEGSQKGGIPSHPSERPRVRSVSNIVRPITYCGHVPCRGGGNRAGTVCCTSVSFPLTSTSNEEIKQFCGLGCLPYS